MTKHVDNTAAATERVFAHMRALRLPQFIIQEFDEQAGFMSLARLQAMTHWYYEQFVEWYHAE